MRDVKGLSIAMIIYFVDSKQKSYDRCESHDFMEKLKLICKNSRSPFPN